MSTDAAVLKRKKTTISRGKIKKTIKNVICRPDAVYWPSITEGEGKELHIILNKYKVPIPEYKKPHWKEIKCLPKSERPKPPPIKRVDGLIFGLSECQNLVDNQQLAALILENEVKPRAIVHPLLEACHKTSVPVLCLSGLKIICSNNFGIATSCLGIKLDILTDLTNKIMDISRKYKPPRIDQVSVDVMNMNKDDVQDIDMDDGMDSSKIECEVNSKISCYPYLYRTDKKRVFVPTNTEKVEMENRDFSGQDYVAFSSIKKHVYKKMVLKRISNNPNRVKVK